jgi:hypothetical protein
MFMNVSKSQMHAKLEPKSLILLYLVLKVYIFYNIKYTYNSINNS